MPGKMKKLLVEIWKDFRSNNLRHAVGSNCCEYDLPFNTSYLRPQPVWMKIIDNHPKKLK